MRLKRLLAILLALGLITAACSSDDGDETETTDTETSDTDDAEDTATDESGSDDTDGSDPAEVAVDYGVTDDTIRIGINGDLSGPFAALVTDIVEGQRVYWEVVNENGGIGGRMIEPVVLDSGYATDKGIENYNELAQESEDGVLMISENTGSPITAAVAEDAADDNMLIIPLSWASLWPDPEFGAAVLEKQTTYCIESMNGVDWLNRKVTGDGEEPKLAILGRPGEYGEDGSAGAKLAAEELGIEIVYDGTGAVAGDDRTNVVTQLVDSDATMVWTTLTPAELLDIFGQAVSQGFEAIWSGNSPSFSYPVHLPSDSAEDFDKYYFQSGYNVTWDTDGVAELDTMKAAMAERRPDLNISDTFLVGWMEGLMVQAILEQAIANGDMTRAGMVAASSQVEVDLRGLAPNQKWSGDYDADVVRESYIFDVDAEAFNLITTSEDVESGDGSSGLIVEEGPFAASFVADRTFDAPCIEPSN